jgi:hypothetical protein
VPTLSATKWVEASFFAPAPRRLPLPLRAEPLYGGQEETMKRVAAPPPSVLTSKRCCPATLRTARWLTPRSRAASRALAYSASFSESTAVSLPARRWLIDIIMIGSTTHKL